MGKRRGLKRKGAAEETRTNQERADRMGAPDVDPARALIAVHPQATHIAASLGSLVRVICFSSNAAVELPGADQQLTVRALAFDPFGRYLLAAGDSKICCAWCCESWSVVFRSVAPKKISAATFTADGKYVIMADKFGDAYAAAIPEGCQDPSSPGEGLVSKPHMLLGHFSSIITTLTVLSHKPWVISTDREGKIRVSKLPADPLQGAPSIQSFCLGHSSFVTSLSIVQTSDGTLIASGSGDGTIRLWDPETGDQLDVLDTAVHLEQSCPAIKDHQEHALTLGAGEARGGNATQDGQPSAPQEQDGRFTREDEAAPTRLHEELPPAVVAMAVTKDGSCLVAAVEGENSLMVLHVARQRLAMSHRMALGSLALPTSLLIDCHDNLWVVEGCAGAVPFAAGLVDSRNLQNAAAEKCEIKQPAIVQKLCTAVAASSKQPDATGVPAEAKSCIQLSLELRKWCYSAEEISWRKQKRSDIAALH